MLVKSVQTQEWTKEQIYQMAGDLITAQLGISLEEFVAGYLEKKFDTCNYMEIVGLLSLLPEDDKLYIGSQRAA